MGYHLSEHRSSLSEKAATLNHYQYDGQKNGTLRSPIVSHRQSMNKSQIFNSIEEQEGVTALARGLGVHPEITRPLAAFLLRFLTLPFAGQCAPVGQ